MHELFLISAGVALESAVLALSVRSGDVPDQKRAHGEVEIVPAAATLAAAETARAQLTLARLELAEPRPAEPAQRRSYRPRVVHVEVLRGEAGVPAVAPDQSCPIGGRPTRGPFPGGFAPCLEPA